VRQVVGRGATGQQRYKNYRNANLRVHVVHPIVLFRKLSR
jgi:hypothetical protein